MGGVSSNTLGIVISWHFKNKVINEQNQKIEIISYRFSVHENINCVICFLLKLMQINTVLTKNVILSIWFIVFKWN